MIHYFETSALVKLFITTEAGARVVRREWDQAPAIATSELTYVEARATLAAAHRARRLDTFGWAEAGALLDQAWNSLNVIGVTAELVRRAGQLAEA